MDMQAVLLCPKTKASTLYYKTKLQLHNFTLFNLQSKEGYCYVWDETEGSLGSEVFAWLQYYHFDKFIDAHPQIKEIIIWSDGCGYQNRNATVTNAYMELAQKKSVNITQKYLVAGHTQMEVDSMHATIERNIVGDIFTPRDYVVVMETARSRPAPYKVMQVKNQDFKKLTGGYVTTIRPGKKSGDPTVHELRGLRYQSNGNILYKLGYGSNCEWEVMPRRIHIPDVPLSWVSIFGGRQPISLRKFNDLQSMKHVLPSHTYHYFDTLPHNEA